MSGWSCSELSGLSNLELWPIGNCQVSGLIDQSGGLVWGCIPRVDGDPVFCSLLNGDRAQAGVWRFELEGQVSASQEYIRNTPILVTRLESGEKQVLVTYGTSLTQNGAWVGHLRAKLQERPR